VELRGAMAQGGSPRPAEAEAGGRLALAEFIERPQADIKSAPHSLYSRSNRNQDMEIRSTHDVRFRMNAHAGEGFRSELCRSISHLNLADALVKKRNGCGGSDSATADRISGLAKGWRIVFDLIHSIPGVHRV